MEAGLIIRAVILDGILILSMYFIGYLLISGILQDTNGLAILSLGFPLGGGMFSFLVFLLSWSGIRISLGTLVITYIGLTSVFLAIHALLRPTGSRFPRPHLDIASLKSRLTKLTLLSSLSLVLIIGLFFLAMFLSVGRSYSIWDSIATWSVKGYGIALEGSIAATDKYGSFDRAYPLNIPLMISFFRLVSGDVLPGSKMIFPLMAASSILGIFRFWRRNSISLEVALGGALLLATMPLFFKQATVGWADLTFACYLVLGVVWAIEGMMTQDRRAFMLSGLILGLACWTRAEGVLYTLGFMFILALAWKIISGKNIKILPWVVPLAVILSIWMVYSLADISSSHLGGAIQATRQSILSGNWQIGAMGMIVGHIIENSITPSLWGVYVPLGIVLLASRWRDLISRKSPEIFTTLLAVIFAALVPITLFYTGSFLFGLDFVPDWLDRSFDRAILPALFLFGALMVMVGNRWILEMESVSAKSE